MATSTETADILKAMIACAQEGYDIIPMQYQPRRGRSNCVSAAIRQGLKSGVLVEAGKDGLGKPKYRLAQRRVH
jgi:hypothetical protein